MPKRQTISKKTRFEIFKRDSFTCQYCGNHPPKCLLEIDHITPLSKGGDNTENNLITSCFECNRGKAARDLSVAPKTLKERALIVAEQEKQLLEYQKIINDQDARIEDEAFEILDYLGRLDEKKRAYKSEISSTKRFVKELGFHETKDAAEISVRANCRNLFNYFCGICWRKIRQ